MPKQYIFRMTEVPNITYCQSKKTKEEYFSILIPSWNNLPYLQLCIDSIKKNSTYDHQIIIHVNEGADGTLEWLENQKDFCYSYSEKNIGVCYALNCLATMARTDYILYMNDDMYVCPQWDKFLLEEIQSIGHNNFFISATAIEAIPQSSCSIGFDFGKDIKSFDEKRLLDEYESLQIEDWSGATWPPNIVHRSLWNLVGGYSIEFSPGMYSDPDFSIKLWKAGVRYFKGIALSRVYHFGSVSVKRVRRNKGYYTFISKWGLTAGTFGKYYIKRGKAFEGTLTEPKLNQMFFLKALYKQILAIFNRNKG